MEKSIECPINVSEHPCEIADRQWILRWIDEQGPVEWLIATLTIAGKSVEDRLYLQKILRQTLRRFEYKVLGGNAVKRRGDRLLCLPVFGGEPRNGTYFHYHLVLEKRSKQPMDVEAFKKLFEIEWTKQIQRLCRWNAGIEMPVVGDVKMEAADPAKLPGWLYYIQRWEGPTLDAGLSKVDMKNLFLKHLPDDVTETESLCC